MGEKKHLDVAGRPSAVRSPVVIVVGVVAVAVTDVAQMIQVVALELKTKYIEESERAEIGQMTEVGPVLGAVAAAVAAAEGQMRCPKDLPTRSRLHSHWTAEDEKGQLDNPHADIDNYLYG